MRNAGMICGRGEGGWQRSRPGEYIPNLPRHVLTRYRLPQSPPGDKHMAQYRVYLLNDSDCIFDWVPVECDSDEGAVARAVAIAREFAVEIWAGARKVARIPAQEVQQQRRALFAR
jgi:hypothetical protein